MSLSIFFTLSSTVPTRAITPGATTLWMAIWIRSTMSPFEAVSFLQSSVAFGILTSHWSGSGSSKAPSSSVYLSLSCFRFLCEAVRNDALLFTTDICCICISIWICLSPMSWTAALVLPVSTRMVCMASVNSFIVAACEAIIAATPSIWAVSPDFAIARSVGCSAVDGAVEVEQ
ncbi:unnamed protein product [Polarella glacialis]|uniref:Secreted protein n=1 Tax=Polarella glacialis TaxID=89957 RepID=A0A813H3S7_POLGL|nr:unnamed protein product [Polarella glacialis]